MKITIPDYVCIYDRRTCVPSSGVRSSRGPGPNAGRATRAEAKRQEDSRHQVCDLLRGKITLGDFSLCKMNGTSWVCTDDKIQWYFESLCD